MANLEEIAVTHRDGGTEEPINPPEKDQSTRSGGNIGGWGRKNSGNVDKSDDSSPGRNRGSQKVDGNRELEGQPAVLKEQDVESPGQDLRDKFYKHYHEEAGEYDKEFMKKYGEDLDTTLIFAGLFSAVTSAFIIEVSSQLQPDPNEEAAALLRVILYNMNNTAFGDNIPTVPQPWTGPPRMIVEVQAVLFASLAASLFAAFLAMLGKQWLNRYESVDMRGSAIERSQNRQRKLDGIVSWYFNYAMESLPLMLQAALLLLGCALSRYLWEINATVASVVLGTTMFGVLFYLFIVVAGAVFLSCPYQTPGSHILRHIPDIPRYTGHTFRHILNIFCCIFHVFHRIPDAFHRIPQYPRVLRSFLHDESLVYGVLVEAMGQLKEAHHSPCKLVISLLFILLLPICLVVDPCRAIVWLLVAPSHRVRLWLQQESKRQVAMLDQHCILWTLRISLDEPIRLLALNYLATMTSADVDPTLIVDCFNILFGCIRVNDYKAAITQGSEQLAAVSAQCCFQMLPHLIAIHPTPRVYENIRQRHIRTFLPWTNFEHLPVLGAIHTELCSGPHADRLDRRMATKQMRWEDHKLSGDEHVAIARVLAKLSQVKYQRSGREKVPRWLLRFVLHSLSQSPLPPTSVVIDCLSIAAIDMGYDSSTTTTTLDESAQLDQVSRWITQELERMAGAEATDAYPTYCRRKAISALIPYAVFLAWDGQQGMADTLSRIARTLNSIYRDFVWKHIGIYITQLFDKPATPLDLVIILASRYVPWRSELVDQDVVTRWAAAALATPYTEEVGQSVVEALLKIVPIDSLRSHIPFGIWALLKKRPSLSYGFSGRSEGSGGGVVRRVRELGDIEILKSYFLLVWSEENNVGDEFGGFAEMQTSIHEDFGGIGMGRHREDLVKRLDHVLTALEQQIESLARIDPTYPRPETRLAVERYGELKRALVELDRDAVNILTQSHSTFVCTLPSPCP